MPKEMKAIETLERLEHIHQLIRQEATGTPEEFAARIHLSRRQLYSILLEELKDRGAEIKYSRMRRTFFYTNAFKMEAKVLFSVE